MQKFAHQSISLDETILSNFAISKIIQLVFFKIIDRNSCTTILSICLSLSLFPWISTCLREMSFFLVEELAKQSLLQPFLLLHPIQKLLSLQHTTGQPNPTMDPEE